MYDETGTVADVIARLQTLDPKRTIRGDLGVTLGDDELVFEFIVEAGA